MSNERRHRNDFPIRPSRPDDLHEGYKPDPGKVPPLPVNTPPTPPPSDSSTNEKK